jgi:hypothetical protein
MLLRSLRCYGSHSVSPRRHGISYRVKIRAHVKNVVKGGLTAYNPSKHVKKSEESGGQDQPFLSDHSLRDYFTPVISRSKFVEICLDF